MVTLKRALKASRWTAMVSGVVALLALVPYLHNRLPAAGISIIDEARFSLERAASHSMVQTLPDDWYLNHPEAESGWYRMTVDLRKVPKQRWAVFLPTVNMNAAIYLNGKLIGDGGDFDAPLARNWNRPMLFPLDPSVLLQGFNTLDVYVQTDPPGSGFLSKLYLGPESELKAVYEQRLFVKVGIVWAITIGLVFLGLFIGALWLLRRHESIYGWFSVVVLVWAAHNLNVLVVDIPVSSWVWDWTTRYGCLQWYAILSVVFVNRYVKKPQPLIEKGLIGIGAGAMLAFATMPVQTFYALARHVWDPLMLSVGVYALYRLYFAYRKQPTAEVSGLLVSALVVVIFGLRDTLMMNQLWDREHGFYLHYGAPVVIVVFAWILLRRFVTALSVSETLNDELQQRVEQKRLELKRNYSHMQTLERERVLAEERERIMRDMHDGVGGHLVSTLALIDRGRTNLTEISESLRSALTDLRLMIDSLDTTTSDLASSLGMLRERLQRRLNVNGIQVHWKVEPLPEIQGFGPHKALQVMRIVQEAITNVLKHAQAKNLTLCAAQEKANTGSRIVVEIIDDGKGVPNEPSLGKGLRNMRYRANAIDADLAIERNPHGTRVKITLPVDAAVLKNKAA